jgi:O-succinylbenzoic acid--CoA ligase
VGPAVPSLTAVALPPERAAARIIALWDSGQAVLPLDPRAPVPDRQRVLDRLRPTHLIDADGERELQGGVPVDGDVAAVVATSGTTGVPRGVELTWAGLDASVAATLESVGARAGDRWLCCLPVHHVAGLAILARAWAGGVVPIIAPFDPESLGSVDAEFVSLVPTALARALDAGTDVSKFKAILAGAASLDAALAKRAREAGAVVVDGYGLSETWGGIVHDGRVLTGAECRIGPEREIWFRGPMVMKQYRLDTEATAAALTPEGWLRTGDAGEVDGDGRLRVVDRLRDIIVTGGVNVSPAEVESVLAGFPGVLDVCVAGRPDPEWGERVVAHVVPADAANPPTLDAVRAFAAERLSAPKLPRQVVIVDAVPRSPSGKVLRRLLD